MLRFCCSCDPGCVVGLIVAIVVVIAVFKFCHGGNSTKVKCRLANILQCIFHSKYACKVQNVPFKIPFSVIGKRHMICICNVMHASFYLWLYV